MFILTNIPESSEVRVTVLPDLIKVTLCDREAAMGFVSRMWNTALASHHQAVYIDRTIQSYLTRSK